MYEVYIAAELAGKVPTKSAIKAMMIERKISHVFVVNDKDLAFNVVLRNGRAYFKEAWSSNKH